MDWFESNVKPENFKGYNLNFSMSSSDQFIRFCFVPAFVYSIVFVLLYGIFVAFQPICSTWVVIVLSAVVTFLGFYFSHKAHPVPIQVIVFKEKAYIKLFGLEGKWFLTRELKIIEMMPGPRSDQARIILRSRNHNISYELFFLKWQADLMEALITQAREAHFKHLMQSESREIDLGSIERGAKSRAPIAQKKEVPQSEEIDLGSIEENIQGQLEPPDEPIDTHDAQTKDTRYKPVPWRDLQKRFPNLGNQKDVRYKSPVQSPSE